MRILIIILISLASSFAWACDNCQLFSYSTFRQENFLGVQYSYSVFNGYNYLDHSNHFITNQNKFIEGDNLHGGSLDETIVVPHQKDYEVYRSQYLVGNFEFKEVWNVRFRLGLEQNVFYQHQLIPEVGPSYSETDKKSGFGDIFIGISRYWQKGDNSTSHLFRANGGVHLPTGEFKPRSTESELFDASHEIGRGSAHVELGLNYMLNKENLYGLIGSALYNISTRKKAQKIISNGAAVAKISELTYRFGSQTSLSAQGFYRLSLGQLSIVPRAGLAVGIHGIDHVNGTVVDNTGGAISGIATGLDLKWKSFILQTDFESTFWSSLKGQQLIQSGDFRTVLMYSF